MAVAVGVDLAVAVAVVPGWDRVEVDTGGLDGRLGLGAIALGIVARAPAPGLHGRQAERGPTRSTMAARRARYACINRV